MAQGGGIVEKGKEIQINNILEVIMKVARGDYSAQVELSGRDDELDSLAMGINMMIDDIRINNQELTDTHLASLNMMEDLNNTLLKLKKVEEELKAKNKELEDYTYTVSHDLKAPLVTIQGFAELLDKKYRDQLDDGGRHYINRITESADHLGGLVTDLLELSRAGRKMKEFEWHDFNEILQISLSGLEGKIKEKEVEVKYPDDFPKAYCDDMRIEQALSNLIGNAINFMGDQKKPIIEMGWESNGSDFNRFWIQDNGVGIKEEDQERIFKIFERSNSDPEGSGIGLSIVKKIIQAHGGEVWVESDYGKGSTFNFTLNKNEVKT